MDFGDEYVPLTILTGGKKRQYKCLATHLFCSRYIQNIFEATSSKQLAKYGLIVDLERYEIDDQTIDIVINILCQGIIAGPEDKFLLARCHSQDPATELDCIGLLKLGYIMPLKSFEKVSISIINTAILLEFDKICTDWVIQNIFWFAIQCFSPSRLYNFGRMIMSSTWIPQNYKIGLLSLSKYFSSNEFKNIVHWHKEYPLSFYDARPLHTPDLSKDFLWYDAGITYFLNDINDTPKIIVDYTYVAQSSGEIYALLTISFDIDCWTQYSKWLAENYIQGKDKYYAYAFLKNTIVNALGVQSTFYTGTGNPIIMYFHPDSSDMPSSANRTTNMNDRLLIHYNFYPSDQLSMYMISFVPLILKIKTLLDIQKFNSLFSYKIKVVERF